jgi:aconitate hydratase
MTTASLELNGSETFDILGLRDAIETGSTVTLLIHRANGTTQVASLICRIDTSYERSYMKHGGILPTMLSRLSGATN